MAIPLFTVGSAKRRVRAIETSIKFVAASFGTTIPSHQAGDLIISYTVQNTTSGFLPDSIPSGWSLLDNGQSFGGSFPTIIYYTSSLVYKIATDSSTTGYATNSLYAVYRGATGVGIGIIEGPTGTWPALSPFQNQNGTSVIMGLGNGSSGQVPSVPTNTFTRYSNAEYKVWDTEIPVRGSSWPSYTSGISSFVYATVELKS